MAECRLLVNVYWLQGKKKAPAERPTVFDSHGWALRHLQREDLDETLF